MQINTISFENTNTIQKSYSDAGKGTGVGKVSFLQTTLEKSGWGRAGNTGIVYNSQGESVEKELTGESAAQNTDFLTYINQSLEQLKNLVTDEDYSQMRELGLAPEKENPGTLVTVYERIQIELAAYCDDYDVNLSGINQEKLKQVLGSEAAATAVKKAQDIGTLNSQTKAYLIKNNLEPSIDQIYKASHSTAGQQISGKELSEQEWEELLPGVKNLLTQNGMEENKNTLEQAKWLVENNLPVTQENLVKIDALNQIDMTDEENLKKNIAYAMIFGMSAESAYMTDGWIEPEDAKDCYDTIQNVDDRVIYAISQNQLVLNIANIKKFQSQEDTRQTPDENDRQYQRNKSVIEQARLCMTAAAFINMQKVGISISYSDISVMVAETKKADENYYQSFFAEEKTTENVAKLSEVMDAMNAMSRIPSTVIGSLYKGETEFTIASVRQQSDEAVRQYDKASITYEAVGTQVRQDLGDSIGKAFESVDGILEAEGLEVNSQSRRAARILAYNQMEINTENVLKMESMMGELDYVKDTLTPKTAAYLVEHQVDIFHTDIHDLNKNLEDINEMLASESENFAEYLWKLEKKDGISEENREKYIELYRTLNQVSSFDARAIGMVVAEGADFTLGNLLSAVKTRGKMGMDVSVDGNFGELEAALETKTQSYEEIGKFVKKLAERTKNGLAAAQNLETEELSGLSLTKLADAVMQEDVIENRQMLASYAKSQMEEHIGAYNRMSEDAMMTMLEGGHEGTIENIASAMELSTTGSVFRKFLLEKQNYPEVAEQVETLLNESEGEVEDAEKIEKLAEEMDAGFINQKEYKKDMRQISQNMKFMAEGMKNQSYHIPVQINKENMLVRVSFEKKDGASSASISMETQSFGKIRCHVFAYEEAEEKNVGILVSCENEEIQKKIEENQQIFIGNAEKIQHTKVNQFATEKTGKEELSMNREKAVDSRYLFQMSKSIIQSVKETLEKDR